MTNHNKNQAKMTIKTHQGHQCIFIKRKMRVPEECYNIVTILRVLLSTRYLRTTHTFPYLYQQ